MVIAHGCLQQFSCRMEVDQRICQSEFVETLDTNGRDVILMDNASIHKTNIVQDTIVSRGMTPCYLPPYTPEFQPIEHCFSVLKNKFRTISNLLNDGRTPEVCDADMQERLSQSVLVITASTLAHQFDACWKRTEAFRG